MASAVSQIVSAGMERLCKDVSGHLAGLGFKKTGKRLWTRKHQFALDTLHLHRLGSSYGAPRNASVDIRVQLGIRTPDNLSAGLTVFSDKVRKPDGHAYHHRFNAETWSTYDLCVSDLVLFVVQFAEPWFKSVKDPAGRPSEAPLG